MSEPTLEEMPSHKDTAAYFRYHAERARETDARLLPYPVPTVTSRDGILPEAPAPVAALQRRAEAAGWTVVRRYSRGCEPHATTGRPSAEKDFHALVMARSDGRRATAIYAGTKSMAWDSLWTWSLTEVMRRSSTAGHLGWALVVGRPLAAGMNPAEPLASRRRGPEWVIKLGRGERLAHWLAAEHCYPEPA